MQFTDESIAALTYMKQGRAAQLHFDADFPRFCVRVHPSGVKTYCIRYQHGGRDSWRTIGRVSQMTLDQARAEAAWRLTEIDRGKQDIGYTQSMSLMWAKVLQQVKESPAEHANQLIDPTSLTLKRGWDEYKLCRSLKLSTVKHYESSINTYLFDWMDSPMPSITKEQVLSRHRLLSEHRGGASANHVMRLLRAIFNFVMHKYDDAEGYPLVRRNPVSIISALRSWNRIDRRKTLIKPHQMTDWLESVRLLSDTTAKDYFIFTLLTGLRNSESALLKWRHVDFAAGTIRIPDTKNHDDHILPLSDFLQALLTRRHEANPDVTYVFHGKTKDSHICNQSSIKFDIERKSHVDFIIHDLRRTYVTIADNLDIPRHIIKRLVNHRTQDVTDGYLILSIDRLRKPMQLITEEILSYLAGNDSWSTTRCFEQWISNDRTKEATRIAN